LVLASPRAKAASRFACRRSPKVLHGLSDKPWQATHPKKAVESKKIPLPSIPLPIIPLPIFL
jgi:hypothetical protein